MWGKTVHFWIKGCSFFVHFLWIISSISSHGQFGNEWINFNQTYYKISVVEKGIHRLTYSDLLSSGLPVNSIDPRRIQIFRRGVEQSIRLQSVQIPPNGIFEPGEYIEFYGDKNDGANDVDIYKIPAHHPHPYYNLYSDTAAYFLTWSLLAVPGKRMAEPNPEINVGGLPIEGGFTSTSLQVLFNEYGVGKTFEGFVQNSLFDEGEGWTGPIICTLNIGCTGQQDFVISIPNGVTSLTPPQLEVSLVGRAEVGHAFEIYAGPNTSSLRLVANNSFLNFQTFKSNVSLQWSDVAADGSMVVRVKGLGVDGVRESLSVSYIRLDYLRNFNFEGLNSQCVLLQANPVNKSYIEVQNAPANLRIFDITDLTSVTLIGTYTQGPNLAAVISNTNTSRKIFASASIITPAIRKISFRSFNRTAKNYIIISHESLHKPALNYSDPVKAYSDYRASSAGGSYDTVTVNSSQLYNQFNYGETSARAVYKFLQYMNSGGITKYLFLIGKGLELNFAYDRKRIFLPTDLKDLVPTGGYPGSDLVFSVGLNGTTYEPAIPTGRLTAANSTEVAFYLNKIKETESLPFNNLWRKNLLHLSGGINLGEPEAFKFYVDGFKSFAEEVYLGGSVETKSKKTLDLENIPIAEQVNSGLSLITFFGHSNTNILDFEVGFVTNPVYGFDNPGKYPAFLINGCNLGRIFDNRTGTQRSFGEDWILAQNKGAKSFIANSSFGFAAALRHYSDLFYENAFGDSTLISKGIGDVQIKVAKALLEYGGPSTYNLSNMQQMVLMGDPAVPIFGAAKPDYAIQNDFMEKVSLDGNPITSVTRSIGIQYKIQNYGQARNDSIKIKLTRVLPDNSIQTYDTLISPIFYENEFIFVVPNNELSGGENSFTIHLDSDDKYVELNEQNNQATLNLFIPSSSTFNLVPYSHSVVNTSSVELIFQNVNQLPVFRDYQIEVDTIPEFSSPFFIQRKIGANVLGRTLITLATKDSTVYYWRTRLDQPSAEESSDWYTTSFTFIANGTDGFMQSSLSQLSDNEFVDLELNPTSGEFVFPGIESTVFVQNFGSANPNPYTATSFKVNNEEFNISQFQLCRNNTICIVAINKNTGSPYAPVPLIFLDARTCGKDPQVINNFTLAEAEAATNGLVQAIANIPVSDSVVLFTIGDAGVLSWSPTIITKLEEIGIASTQLSGFQSGEPMIVFGRKGSAPGMANVIRPTTTPANEQQLVVNETVTAKPSQGSMRSVKIGPARFWNKLYYSVSNQGSSDIYNVKIIGTSESGIDQVLYSGNANPVDLSFIDPITYQNLKIEIQSTDATELTPVKLKNWMVDYTPAAEGILLFRGNPDPFSLFEGQTWNGTYSYINLTKHDFLFQNQGDSLNALFKIINQPSGTVHSEIANRKSPLPFDSIVYNLNIDTRGKAGTNDVQLALEEKPVPEQYLFNNSLLLENYLIVIPDKQPPVLDVTVDGRYLVNGDDVSSNPKIQVVIIDENSYYFKTDTLGIEIQISNLNSNNSKRINFSDSNLFWSPASNDSDFEIAFTSSLLAGEYELSVWGVDASGNKSGVTPYKVSFFVRDESKVELGSVYPNPSNSIFLFPIKLSGNELPESFQLKIFGPDGRLTKQYDLADVSGFHIGTNNVKWNASDFNDLLPIGLYYYTIEISVQGNAYSKAGKILLIRP